MVVAEDTTSKILKIVDLPDYQKNIFILYNIYSYLMENRINSRITKLCERISTIRNTIFFVVTAKEKYKLDVYHNFLANYKKNLIRLFIRVKLLIIMYDLPDRNNFDEKIFG